MGTSILYKILICQLFLSKDMEKMKLTEEKTKKRNIHCISICEQLPFDVNATECFNNTADAM